MTKEIIIKYSEDFRDSKIPREVYGILRDKNLKPWQVTTNYLPKFGIGATIYYFYDTDLSLPTKQELKKMLNGIPFNEIIVEND